MEYGKEQSTTQSTGGRNQQHMLILDARQKLEITGVLDVIRFEDFSAELLTEMGRMFVEGEGLRIDTFDTGRSVVTLHGKISTIDYLDESISEGAKKKRRFFGK